MLCRWERPRRRQSEVGLEPQPEQVIRLLEPTRVKEDGAAEHGMLPVEVHLEEFVEIPVETGVDHLSFIGPEHRIGQAAREHLPAQLELAEAGRELEGPQSKMARTEV